jgi:hypothetical protein
MEVVINDEMIRFTDIIIFKQQTVGGRVEEDG